MSFKEAINELRDMQAILGGDGVDFRIEITKLGEENVISFKASYFYNGIHYNKYTIRESEFVKSPEKVIKYAISKFLRDCKEVKSQKEGD